MHACAGLRGRCVSWSVTSPTLRKAAWSQARVVRTRARSCYYRSATSADLGGAQPVSWSSGFFCLRLALDPRGPSHAPSQLVGNQAAGDASRQRHRMVFVPCIYPGVGGQHDAMSEEHCLPRGLGRFQGFDELADRLCRA
jgi:hypothetical protein